MFKGHKSIEKKQIRFTNKIRGNTSNIRGKQQTSEKPSNIHRNELFDNKCHFPLLFLDIYRKMTQMR